MRKNLTLVWVCVLCMLGISTAAQAQNRFRPEPAQVAEIEQVVKTSRDAWLQIFPADELPEYGFRNEQEKLEAVPGKPIEVYNMYRTFEGLIQSQPAGEFLVPLLLDGKPKVFLTVAFFENRWQVVAVGEMNLAQEAGDFIAKSKESGSLIWLRNLNHSADFIANAGTALTEAQLQFVPLSTAQRASFKQPIGYADLEARISKMIVQFD